MYPDQIRIGTRKKSIMEQLKTWDDLRVEIKKIVREKGISANDFTPLNIYEWESIE